MPIMTRPPAEARLAIGYITSGAILDVWTGIWYWYLRNNPPETGGPYYFCAGLFLTGLVFMMIGFALGRIGRAARRAELPPPEVVEATKVAERTAAAHPVVVLQPPVAAQSGIQNLPPPSPPAPAAPPVAPVAPIVSVHQANPPVRQPH